MTQAHPPRPPITVGIIGYGLAGRVFHAPMVRAAPGLALVAIATSRADEVAALDPAIRAQTDPADLVADPEIELIVIASPTGTHYEWARAALLAGKHVVVDKPFTLTLAQARELADLAQTAGRLLLVFHNRRWDSCFMAVRAAIEEGLIGRVTRFHSRFERYRPHVRDRWRENGAPGSGVWYDLGPHLVDQALVLFGAPDAVTADIATLREGAGSDDEAQVTLHYPAMRVHLSASMNAPDASAGGAPRFTVHGTGGTLVKPIIDQQENQIAAGMHADDPMLGVDEDPLLIYPADGPLHSRPAPQGAQGTYYWMVAAHLHGTGQPPITLTESLAVQEVIEAAIIASRDGRKVMLPLP